MNIYFFISNLCLPKYLTDIHMIQAATNKNSMSFIAMDTTFQNYLTKLSLAKFSHSYDDLGKYAKNKMINAYKENCDIVN